MNSRRRKISTDDRQTGVGSQILGLSLFVMLLAFFIVLNAISSYEDVKSKPIVQGVSQAFSTKALPDTQYKSSAVESSQMGAGEGDTVEQLDRLFRGQIKSVDILTNRQTGVIVIDVSRADFEAALNELGHKDQSTKFGKNFLQTLASVLRSDQRSMPYRMDIMYHVDGNPGRLQNTDPQTISGSIAAVAAAAQLIEKAGLPTKLMSIGLQQGKPDRVELFFQPFDRFTPPATGGKDG